MMLLLVLKLGDEASNMKLIQVLAHLENAVDQKSLKKTYQFRQRKEDDQRRRK